MRVDADPNRDTLGFMAKCMDREVEIQEGKREADAPIEIRARRLAYELDAARSLVTYLQSKIDKAIEALGPVAK